MDLFLKANRIRLVSYRDRYLVAEEDQVTISQGSDGSAKNAIWAVEFVEGNDCIRLLSCFGTYLTATSMPFLRGFSGQKVIQRWPSHSNSASEWELVRDGMQVRLRSLCGYFLRPSSGLPPWKNSVTHDVPHWGKMREKLLWSVEVVEKCPNQGSRTQEHPTNSLPVVLASLPGCQKRSDYRVNRGLVNERMEICTSVRWLWHGKTCSPCSR